MTMFTDGPARDSVLSLQRSPVFLRVVVAPDGEVDALDLLDDMPKTEEKVFAYRRQGALTLAFVDGSKFRGRVSMANYRLVPEQPDERILRDQLLWREWCHGQERP